MASWADFDTHCATGCSFLCEHGTYNNFCGHAFFLSSPELRLPKLMILIGSCTVDIADDTMWLTLFYWPFDLKWTCQKLWQKNVVNLLDAAHMKDTHSDCILHSTASIEAVLPPWSWICWQCIWVHRCSCHTDCWVVLE